MAVTPYVTAVIVLFVFGICFSYLAGSSRAMYSLVDWFPVQVYEHLQRTRYLFPLCGSKVNNSFPLTMDYWHFRQWIFRIGMMIAVISNLIGLLMVLPYPYYYGSPLLAILLTGVLEGNIFKFRYHYFWLEDREKEPYRPLSDLLVPFDLRRKQ